MNTQDILCPLMAIWNFVKDFANSSFVTALNGSAAGAWAGAAIVQKIIEKERGKTTLLDTHNRALTLNRFMHPLVLPCMGIAPCFGIGLLKLNATGFSRP